MRLPPAVVGALALVSAAACTTLIALPDVPEPADAGGNGPSGSGSSSGIKGSADSGSSSGDATTRDDTTTGGGSTAGGSSGGSSSGGDSSSDDASSGSASGSTSGSASGSASGGPNSSSGPAGHDGWDAGCTSGAVSCGGAQPEECIDGSWVASDADCSDATATCTGDACAAPPSCQASGAGLDDCGVTSESCCVSLEVPAGSFYRTFDGEGAPLSLAADGGPAGEADPAAISAFRLDKYSVTVGRFRQFVSAWNGGYAPPAGSGKHAHLNGGLGLVDIGAPADAGTVYEAGWLLADNGNIDPTDANLACDAPYTSSYGTWTSTPSGQENLPINCINWWEAYAFCIWDGGFLPSEAEWEYAASGGDEQRPYPWGSAGPGPANDYDYMIYGCYYPTASGTCTGPTNIAPVGTATLGAGPWGQLDLLGNMWQWNLDWATRYVDPCIDCAYLTQTASAYRGLRGGWASSFTNSSNPLSNPYRGNRMPAPRYAGNGVRCARSP
jgi:sulfatase modifying factor 1